VWPLHIMVGVGDTAVSVGTDDAAVIAMLEPWRIDETADLVDYGIRLNLAGATQRGAARAFPYLRHGSHDIARSRDPQVLIDALMRILGALERPAQPGQVRLALMPLMRNGSALLAPETHVGTIPERWMDAHGISRCLATSTLVDLDSLAVVIEPPLGSAAATTTVPLMGWWFASYNLEREFTPGGAVALAMGIAEGKHEANAHEILTGLVSLVARLPPGLAPLAQTDVQEAIDATLP